MTFEHAGPSPEEMGVEAKAKTPKLPEQPSDFIEHVFAELQDDLRKDKRLRAIGEAAELAARFDRVMEQLKRVNASKRVNPAYVKRIAEELQSHFTAFREDVAKLDDHSLDQLKQGELPSSLKGLVDLLEVALDKVSGELKQIER